MERNILSFTQLDYYASLLHNYTYITYTELLAFSVGMGGEGGKEKS